MVEAEEMLLRALGGKEKAWGTDLRRTQAIKLPVIFVTYKDNTDPNTGLMRVTSVSAHGVSARLELFDS
jgi:hypothetical protein